MCRPQANKHRRKWVSKASELRADSVPFSVDDRGVLVRDWRLPRIDLVIEVGRRRVGEAVRLAWVALSTSYSRRSRECVLRNAMCAALGCQISRGGGSLRVTRDGVTPASRTRGCERLRVSRSTLATTSPTMATSSDGGHVDISADMSGYAPYLPPSGDMRFHLQSILDSKEKQLQQAGTLGQQLLTQRVELEERIRQLQELDLDGGDGEDVRGRYRELADTIKAWDAENEQLSSAFGLKVCRAKSPDSVQELMATAGERCVDVTARRTQPR